MFHIVADINVFPINITGTEFLTNFLEQMFSSVFLICRHNGRIDDKLSPLTKKTFHSEWPQFLEIISRYIFQCFIREKSFVLNLEMYLSMISPEAI